MRLSHLGRSIEMMWRGRNQAAVFTAINEQQFHLSHCYRIGDPSGVSWAVTNVELVPKWCKCFSVLWGSSRKIVIHHWNNWAVFNILNTPCLIFIYILCIDEFDQPETNCISVSGMYLTPCVIKYLMWSDWFVFCFFNFFFKAPLQLSAQCISEECSCVTSYAEVHSSAFLRLHATVPVFSPCVPNICIYVRSCFFCRLDFTHLQFVTLSTLDIIQYPRLSI
jgi:hypothetical protein